jgi:mono/diheme cytochrome c family protein/glucose/arabinose dehydrogenase
LNNSQSRPVISSAMSFSSMRSFSSIILVLTLSCLSLFAQIGDRLDKPGTVQKSLVPEDQVPPGTPRSPAETVKSFKVAPGMRVDVVAAEPLVEDPMEAQFDPQGRLWVVEMRGYMPNIDGGGEDAPVGRVSILTDTNGDGIMDTRQTFLDHLILPRALMFVGDGVLIGAPPKLWYCRDTNNDGVCDVRTEVANDFGVQTDPKFPMMANPERAPNSLLWNRDNWIYGAHYTAKFRYHNGKFERMGTIFRGQFGLSQNDDGTLFYNSNSDQLRADVIPDYYLGRNPAFQGAEGINVKVPTDQYVWPARVTPGINRGYRPEMLRDGRLKEFTSACAPFVLRSDIFPSEFYGNVFVAEPAANLVHRDILFETNGTIVATNAYDKAEFIASTDERFRPVNFTQGPDGALYIVDMYRGVIQHRASVTTYLRQQSESRGLVLPTHLGRIYRVIPEGQPHVARKPNFPAETPSQWVQHLSDANAWWRETAQRLLVEHRDKAPIAELNVLASKGPGPLGQLHALWTLQGLDAVSVDVVRAALASSNSSVRAAAIHVSENLFGTEDKSDAVDLLEKITAESDPKVQLQLALTLGQLHDSAADERMVSLLDSGSNNKFLQSAILSGLFSREFPLLERLLQKTAWNNPDKAHAAFLSKLASCVMLERNATAIDGLLKLTAQQKGAAQVALLQGMIAPSQTLSRKPVKLKTEPKALAQLKSSVPKDSRKSADKLASLIVWPGKPGVKPEPIPTPLTPEEQARFAQGKTLFAGTCAACHQLHGLGMEGLAPPLADSEWVLGSDKRLIRIVLNGLRGAVRVNGRVFKLDMPSMRVFNDDQLAAILTYIRREWDNNAAPVTAAEVKKIRAATADRQDAWTEKELNQF